MIFFVMAALRHSLADKRVVIWRLLKVYAEKQPRQDSPAPKFSERHSDGAA